VRERRKRRSKEVVEMEREIVERLAERMRRSIKPVGFGMLYEWVLIWRVLFISCMDDGYVEVLGLLRDYLDGKMDMKKLREKLEEVERVYEERLKRVRVECVAEKVSCQEEELLF
jgi:hypothetical protein